MAAKLGQWLNCVRECPQGEAHEKALVGRCVHDAVQGIILNFRWGESAPEMADALRRLEALCRQSKQNWFCEIQVRVEGPDGEAIG
jgi:hypothetical protein